MRRTKLLLNAVHRIAVFNRRIQVLAKLLAEAMTCGERVLDVGCDDGTLASAVMKLNPSLKFQGVDVLERPSVAIPVRVYDGTHIPFEDRSFDWVKIVDVLHHTDDPGIVLRECARVCRKGILLKDHICESASVEKRLRFMDWVGNRGHDVRLPYNYLSNSQWDALFSEAGLKPSIRRSNLGLYPFPFNYLFEGELHIFAVLEK